MSRVGRLPTVIPADVTAAVSADNVVSVKGSKDELAKVINKNMNITVKNNQVVVIRPSDQKEYRALHGLTKVLINNMIIGVEKGFEKSLELIGIDYRVQLQGKKLVMNLGYLHPVEIELIEGITFETPAATKVIVKGIDKEEVGAAAANIRPWRKPGPYKGKGIKYDDEVTRRKGGKTDKK